MGLNRGSALRPMAASADVLAPRTLCLFSSHFGILYSTTVQYCVYNLSRLLASSLPLPRIRYGSICVCKPSTPGQCSCSSAIDSCWTNNYDRFLWPSRSRPLTRAICGPALIIVDIGDSAFRFSCKFQHASCLTLRSDVHHGLCLPGRRRYDLAGEKIY